MFVTSSRAWAAHAKKMMFYVRARAREKVKIVRRVKIFSRRYKNFLLRNLVKTKRRPSRLLDDFRAQNSWNSVLNFYNWKRTKEEKKNSLAVWLLWTRPLLWGLLLVGVFLETLFWLFRGVTIFNRIVRHAVVFIRERRRRRKRRKRHEDGVRCSAVLGRRGRMGSIQ